MTEDLLTQTADLPPPFSLSFHGITHDVYRFGSGGAPIILMHEITGMTPALLALACRIADAHFTVYAPHFFGPVGKRDELPGFLFCLRHELNCWATDKPSNLAPWLCELSRRASRECGNYGVGVIGLCLTGNIVLSMMVEPVIRVPVLCEPSLPILHKKSLGIPPQDLASAANRRAALPLLAYRFDTDTICPAQKFHTLENVFGEDAHLTTIATGQKPYFIPDGSHSVLTGPEPWQHDPNHPIHHVFDEILYAMRIRLVRIPDPVLPTLA